MFLSPLILHDAEGVFLRVSKTRGRYVYIFSPNLVTLFFFFHPIFFQKKSTPFSLEKLESKDVLLITL